MFTGQKQTSCFGWHVGGDRDGGGGDGSGGKEGEGLNDICLLHRNPSLLVLLH